MTIITSKLKDVIRRLYFMVLSEPFCASYSLIKVICITLVLSCVLPTVSYADTEGGGSGGGASCSGPQPCSSMKCNAEFNSSGVFNFTSSSNQIDGACIKKNTASGCFNSNPTSSSGSYTGLGYRPNGAGGNGTPRNHYGSDIGGGGKTNINVYAAADGTVKWVGTSGGGGRTVVIEHERKCTGNAGKYKTIYRHLFRIQVAAGQAVTKGTTIGVEGGSNAASAGAPVCDNPDQRKLGTDGYGGRNCGHSYAIHLHFEVVNSPMGGSTWIGGEKNKILYPNCGGLQTLCGGCPAETKNCKGFGATSDGSTASMEGVGGVNGDGAGGTGGGGEQYNQDNCQFGQYLKDQDCTFCPLFKKLFNAASVMAEAANRGLATPSKSIVSVAFLIWLAVYILKQISSFSRASTGAMLKGILFQGFRVAVVILALNGAIYQMIDLTLTPVLETGLEFAKDVSKSSSGAAESCDSSQPFMEGLIGYDSSTGFPQLKEGSSETTGGLPKSIGASILCNIKALENSTGFLMNLGKYSMCISWDRYRWPLSKGPLPHFGYLTTGIVLWITGLMLLISFPWCLVDCILQLCIAVALIPCAVGAYAFKVTTKYLRLVWSMFMNAMFNFVFMAIIIYIINKHLMEWIGYNPGTNPNDQIFITAWSSKGLAWWGPGCFKIFAICLFSWSFFDEAKSMANHFSQGVSLHNIGGKIGGTVTSAAVNKAIVPGAQLAAKGTWAAAKGVGQATNSLLGNQTRNGLNFLRGKAVGALGGKHGVNENGEEYVEKTFNILGFRHTRRITRGADGIYRQDKETHERDNYEKYFKITTDENGQQHVAARKTFMGMTLFGALGTQEMESETDELGRTTWRTKEEDSNGNVQNRHRNIVFGADGQVQSFNKYENLDEKNALTRVLHDKSGKEHSISNHGVVHHGGTRTTNDAFMQTRDLTDAQGNSVGRTFDFRNVTANHLQNSDGTMNMRAVSQIINGAHDKQLAFEGVVAFTMQKRGMRLDDQYQSRKTQMTKDGLTIEQVNLDGTKTIVNAKLMDDQLVLENTTRDTHDVVVGTDSVTGRNITKKVEYTSRYEKNNGMFTQTDMFNYNKETGRYNGKRRYDISDYWKNRNKYLGAFNEKGEWGTDIDSTRVQKGFSNADLAGYQQILHQMKHPDPDTGVKKNYLDIEMSAPEASTPRQTGPQRQELPNERTTPEIPEKQAELQRLQNEDLKHLQDEMEQVKKDAENDARSATDNFNDEARQGNNEQTQINNRIAEINAQINEFNHKLSDAKSKSERTDLSAEERTQAQKEYETLMSQLDTLNEQIARQINETQTWLTDWQKRRDAHNNNNK